MMHQRVFAGGRKSRLRTRLLLKRACRGRFESAGTEREKEMGYQETLLEWYFKNKRDLPWRRTEDPYRIWISEIMLQQTRVQTVIPYYERFLRTYPTIESLGKGEEEDVLRLWQGLGYYGRARRLIPCARMIVQVHGGVFPRTCGEMAKLPGIGPYTAGAVLSIAYNLPVPAVDGNVMRVFARQFEIYRDIKQGANRKFFEEKARSLLPEDRRHFNQALMELGALICTPENPDCDSCPMKSHCRAYGENLQSRLPVRSRPAEKKRLKIFAAYVKKGQDILLVKQTGRKLLGGLWGFPMVEGLEPEQAAEALKEVLRDTCGIKAVYAGEKAAGRHAFTHLVWEIVLLSYETEDGGVLDGETVWASESDMGRYPMSVAFSKLLY